MPTREKYRVTVTPRASYLPEQSDEKAGRYVFSYTITITNTGKIPAQLFSRHWIITDANHTSHEVRGLGVVGEQPLLMPGESYEYTSGTAISTPVGTMRGPTRWWPKTATTLMPRSPNSSCPYSASCTETGRRAFLASP